MKKIFTFLCAALMSVGMFGKTITEDISMDAANWTWGYGSAVVADGDMLKCILTSEWGAMAIGWNEPTRDLSEWDRIVIVVENMNGCDGEWFKLKAYLRDYVNKDSEQGQMEATLGLDAEDRQQNYMVINLKEEGKNVNLTACGVLGIQCQPNGAEFKISRVYFEKEVEDVTYTLQLVADPEKGSVAVSNLLGSDIIDNGNGNYTVPENAEVTILATPLEGYEFSGWKVGNRWCDFTECGTALNTLDNPLTITMTEDVAYKAEFAAVATTYTLLLVADPAMGSVEVTNLLGSDIIDNGNGNYTVPENAEVTILATPLEGYEFSGWKTGNIDDMVGCYYCGTALNTEDNPLTFTMTADVAYLAEFEVAQGIENIVLTEKTQKVVVDGVLYIVRDNKLFNIQGAQVR